MKYMKIKEFRKLGLLQEINRCFLHPMGLALEIVKEENGNEEFGKIWDFRDDPEGMMFGNDFSNNENALICKETVAKMFNEKKVVRNANFGWHIQPCEKLKDEKLPQ